MKKAAIICEDPKQVSYVYANGRREKLESIAKIHPVLLNVKNLEQEAPKLKDVEALFSTWGMPFLSASQIESFLPSLKAVFYAAGSVKGFAPAFLDKGIIVVSAWEANAIPVAEFTCAQILLSCKGYFRNSREARDPDRRINGKCNAGRGVFGEKVGFIGCGMIARYLIKLLKPFNLRILVNDPYLTDDDAKALGVEKAELAQIFSDCYVVSNHLPNLESLRGVLDWGLFNSMREGATFINTGRGAQVNESDLVDVLRKRQDLTALLDVTDPEPPLEQSPFYTMANIRITSHIAGSMNDEVVRLADYVIEDFLNWEAGAPLKHAVTKDMLPRMA